MPDFPFKKRRQKSLLLSPSFFGETNFFSGFNVEK
jgi:hypothetical protein